MKYKYLITVPRLSSMTLLHIAYDKVDLIKKKALANEALPFFHTTPVGYYRHIMCGMTFLCEHSATETIQSSSSHVLYRRNHSSLIMMGPRKTSG